MSHPTLPDRPLRVAVVSKATAAGGGASRVAQELAALLRSAGHQADHWVGFYSGPPQPHILQLHGRVVRPLVRFAHRLTQRLGLQEILPVEYPVLSRALDGYDLVHFHDISSAASPLTVLLTSRRVPTVWTYHDCSPFTGGCIQPLGCGRFRPGGSACRGCPQRGCWPLTGALEGSGALYAVKRRMKGARRWKSIAPSAWMAELAFSSGLEPEHVEVLPNGVDCSLFHPRDEAVRRRVRAQLGLPENGPVALLCSGSLTDRFKGVDYGLRALEALGDEAPALLAIGGGDEAVRGRLERFRHASLGYLHDQRRLAELFGVCDFLVYPSLADNLPLVVLETQASGLPVAAFATGGIPEMVEDGVSGRLCAPGDGAGLSRCVRDLLAPGAARRMGAAARKSASARFSHELFLRRHLNLYARVLAAQRER